MGQSDGQSLNADNGMTESGGEGQGNPYQGGDGGDSEKSGSERAKRCDAVDWAQMKNEIKMAANKNNPARLLV